MITQPHPPSVSGSPPPDDSAGALASLFEPFDLHGLRLRNRFVQTSMYSWFATAEGEVSDRHLAYMVERARGGVGLLMVENTCVDWELGRGSGIPIRIDEDRFIPGLNDLVNAVHREGAAIGVQLYHPGRQSDARAPMVRAGVDVGQPAPISASDVTSRAIGDQPRPMELREIDLLVERFAAAALRAVSAGFDVVEVHAVHGYLLTQFFSPQSNRRQDEYGGSVQNRARLARRVVRRVREVVGADYPLICRFSADERVPGGASLEDNLQLARWLAEDGIDVFNVSAGTYESREWIYTPANVPAGSLVPLATDVKATTGRPVIGISRLGMDLETAAGFVSSGAIDLVGMGRSQLADPHVVRKAAEGRRAETRPCIACAECAREFIAKQRRMQCVVNPELGSEFRHPLRRAIAPRKVVVIGGGPAGLEAARAAALRGHGVSLLEGGRQLGGQLRHAAGSCFHGVEMSALLAWWTHELDRLGVQVELGHPVAPAAVTELDADDVLVATGANWVVPPAVAAAFGDVPTAHDVLLDPTLAASRVVVLGGTEAGLNAAATLATAGRRVTLVEPGQVGLEISDLMRQAMVRQAVDMGLELLEGFTLCEATGCPGSWTLTVVSAEGVEHRLDVETVVATSLPLAADQVWRDPLRVRAIGSVGAPQGRLYQCTQDGFWATVER